ncbi:hypothetical protein LYSHEL_27670 [Lysobacter helvus]|uniref:DUF4239 domain-containing protein n=2 Tax=Lysobacteraceae TaxID=32033 RepID=A0ABM7Q8R8_9GAMM|nr:MULTISPECIES: hypothetical protein [Lysobacter]BCT93740.1 hypothetical protein LYSCAS_27640 [Lysobacter caseinilyticus]BCT96896.1 hypothetical protein LYSHEL_27670 [Lysobacter helvus]
MSMDSIPIWGFFFGTILVVMASAEAGVRLGLWSLQRADHEKESSASGVSGAILGLTAFMLAFTFGIVAQRFDARKELVRDDASAIRGAYLRADFLPEPERTEARRLTARYLDVRLSFVQGASMDPAHLRDARAETQRIQRRLWELARANAARDMNSDIGALYVEALNTLYDVDAQRMAIGLQARVPFGVWALLLALMVLGMVSIGYFTGIAGSRRSKAMPILAIAFAAVVLVIAKLDRPSEATVTQQPLIDLQTFIRGSAR